MRKTKGELQLFNDRGHVSLTVPWASPTHSWVLAVLFSDNSEMFTAGRGDNRQAVANAAFASDLEFLQIYLVFVTN